MTRDWLFTLNVIGKDYNLWDDLIMPTITDKTFTSSAYVPNNVCELEIQNQTPGAVITRATGKTGAGFSLTSGSWDINRAPSNAIDLKTKYFRTDTAGAKLYVQIIAN